MSGLKTVFWIDNKCLQHRVYSVIKYIMFNSFDSIPIEYYLICGCILLS